MRAEHSGGSKTSPDRGEPLAGVRICLVFEFSLSHYSRLLQEIRALRDAGAHVRWLTSHVTPDGEPQGVERMVAPLEVTRTLEPSHRAWRLLRIADNLARNLIRPLATRVLFRPSGRVRAQALRRLVGETDLFWVIDYPSLPSVMKAAENTALKVVYETVDLVPEYPYQGEEHRRRSLEGERRLVGKVDGFITACDSYADYYVEHYGMSVLKRRPLVRDNMPDHSVSAPKATSSPLRMLFLGSLMYDRPIQELIEAMALTRSDSTLDFQGKNYLGEAPATLIDQRGLQSRVRILAPCSAEQIVETAFDYDVGIVALNGTNENERRASTSKLFTFISAGLAILGSNLPGIARVVDEYQNGRLVDGMEAADWARAIDGMAGRSDEEIDAMRNRSLAAADAHSWARQKPRFVDEFTRVLGREPQLTSGGRALDDSPAPTGTSR